jgi:NAD-binding of NADP-dependent 3-hydroxyisobutyrate dehydrogenase
VSSRLDRAERSSPQPESRRGRGFQSRGCLHPVDVVEARRCDSRTVSKDLGLGWAGLLLKLALNISLAAQTRAFSEGLLLAERGWIDPRLAPDVMSANSIGSPMLKARVPLILDLAQHAWFDVAFMCKDIRLARNTADELATPLPSAALLDEILTRAHALGYAHRDLAALYEVLAKSSATTAPPTLRPMHTVRRERARCLKQTTSNQARSWG